MRKLLVLIVVLYVLSGAFDSVIRWLLSMVHADPLIYLRDFGLVLVVLISAVILISTGKSIMRFVWLMLALAVGVCIALFSELNVLQVLFGVKVWLPFIAGFVLVETGDFVDLDRPRAWAALWGIVCAGVIVNHFYRYPWIGLSIQLGDVSITGNREWTAGRVQRLSGFSRSSFDAAIIVYILYAYLVTTFKGALTRILLFLLSAVAIVMTTTKGLAAVLAGTLVVLPMLGMVKSPRSLARGLLVAGLIFVALVGLVVPLISLRLPFPQFKEGTMEFYLFSSLLDRAWDMWPRSLALVSDWQLVFGRGLGGIGVSQSYFEPGVYSAADNLFVYLYVTAGLAGALLYGFFAYSSKNLALQEAPHRFAFLMIFCMFGYGLTTNIIESAELSLVVGGLASFLLALNLRKPERQFGTEAAAAGTAARVPVA